jgi:hypothetical protein
MGHELELVVAELGEGPNVLGSVDDDLLSLEGRELVGNDAHRPAWSVRLMSFREGEDFGRRLVLTALAERAALELLVCLRIELNPAFGSRPGGSCRRDGNDAP